MLTPDILKGFSSSLLQKNYDQQVESPPCHMEWWNLFTSKHPQAAIAAPRGHAKSTAITFAYLLANVVFRERSYILLISDTVGQSAQFLSDIKKELIENESIVSLFGIKEFLKDTEDDVIVLFTDGHQARITARGSEQKLRGLKWRGKRPDLVVCDDLENDEIVMNKDRREKFKRWFYGALIPCLSANGLIRIVGTILHEDSLLNNLMPKEYDKFTERNDLKTWSTKKSSWLSVKYKAHNDDLTKILWPSRYDRNFFIAKKEDFTDRGIPDVYSQEYLNEPIDETIAFFKRADFMAMSKEDRPMRLHYYITADLAISKEETADYSVFVIAGIDENKQIQVRNVIRERLDGREIVDTIIALQRSYSPELIGIEEMQVSKSIGPFLREEMLRTGVFPSILTLKHQGKDKIARARSIQARMRAGSVKFDKGAEWYSRFEDELCKFPRSTKDDQVDAFAYLGMMLDSLVQAPTNEEVEEEEYLDDLRETNGDYGRNTITGY